MRCSGHQRPGLLDLLLAYRGDLPDVVDGRVQFADWTVWEQVAFGVHGVAGLVYEVNGLI
jgi:hypothetical protein